MTLLLDSHLHLVDRTRIRYPWLKDVPALDRNWSIADYSKTARRLGICGALHMEVDCDPSDIALENMWVAELMQAEESLLLGAISSARPEEEGFAAFLDGLDSGVVKGIRRVLHVVPDDVSQSDLFRENIRRLGPRDLPFDLCVLARQLPIAMELVDACPEVTFVLDHCGVPDIAGGGSESWAKALREIAKRPNVNAKLSGIPTYAAPDWTLDTLKPYAETLLETFGAERIVWGSDSPVVTLNSNLDQWIAVTRAFLAPLSQDEAEAIGNGNARRIWSL